MPWPPLMPRPLDSQPSTWLLASERFCAKLTVIIAKFWCSSGVSYLAWWCLWSPLDNVSDAALMVYMYVWGCWHNVVRVVGWLCLRIVGIPSNLSICPNPVLPLVAAMGMEMEQKRGQFELIQMKCFFQPISQCLIFVILRGMGMKSFRNTLYRQWRSSWERTKPQLEQATSVDLAPRMAEAWVILCFHAFLCVLCGLSFLYFTGVICTGSCYMKHNWISNQWLVYLLFGSQYYQMCLAVIKWFKYWIQ